MIFMVHYENEPAILIRQQGKQSMVKKKETRTKAQLHRLVTNNCAKWLRPQLPKPWNIMITVQYTHLYQLIVH
jgi:hypothetical protein